jgi:enoyl-CoA hydratase/carnithine racemase
MSVDVEQLRRGVQLIRLNRPDRLNAIDDALINGLHEAIDAVERDRSCRAVIITGAGRGFCAGFDMKGGDYEGDPTSRPLADLLAGQQRLSGIALRLHELPKAVIAAVNGPAAGGGFALAVAADIRLASDTAVFVAANVKIGVSGGEMGLSWRLPRLIGHARASDLLLTGRRMNAEEALAAGLVSRITPIDSLLDSAVEVAEQVAANSSFSTWMTKELLDASEGAGSFRHALHLEERTQVLCNFTGDVAEAVAAFREGRSPQFG